jgi:transcription initiation factor TFIIE subunit beta
MSSYLERQQNSFTSGLSAAASKLSGGKRPLAPPSPSPSITSTTSAAAGTTPTKKDRDVPTVFSQPANTGTGNSLLAQMTYVIDWLKQKDEPKTVHEILEYISGRNKSQEEQEEFANFVRNNPHIQWIPDPSLSEQTWRSGTYLHRPLIPNVKTKTQLLGYLQKRVDAQGVSVKDLKDGWADCEAAIDDLEREHRVLVVRWKKDNHPKTVWINDASLVHPVDPEFQTMWHKVEVPGVDMIVQRLSAVGQKPTSEDPRLKMIATPKVEKKKKRATRRQGKATNTHMEHLLKDYSHLKR